MRRTLLLAIVITTVLLLAGSASAGKKEGTNEILAWGDSIGIKIDTEDKSMDVEYEVTVKDGAEVSVYYVPEKGWEEYNDDTKTSFTYVPMWSSLDTRSAKESFTETDGGVWYVIIENADMDAIGENSTIDYKVTWEALSVGDWMVNIGICLAIVIVIIVVVFFIRRVRKKAEPVPPAMAQPYDQQYQQGYDQQQYQTQRPMAPSDMGPGYVPPEPGQDQTQQPAYDPHRQQEPPQY